MSNILFDHTTSKWHIYNTLYTFMEDLLIAHLNIAYSTL